MADEHATEIKNEMELKNNTKPERTLVYTWGLGVNGELGHNFKDIGSNKKPICSIPKLVTIKTNYNIIKVSCGEGYACAIDNIGHLFTWGISYKCGLGSINDKFVKKPQLVKYFVDNKIKAFDVSCGECHMGIITSKGKVYLWGKSQNGCIGDGNDKTHNVLVPYYLKLKNDIKIIGIDLGWKTTALISEDNDLYTFGCATTKTLGHKVINKNYTVPTKVKFGNDNIKVKQVCLGSHHSGCIDLNGNVWVWGSNSWYNLGLGNNKDKKQYYIPQLLSKKKYFDNIEIVNIQCTKNMMNPVKGAGKEGLSTFVINKNGMSYL